MANAEFNEAMNPETNAHAKAFRELKIQHSNLTKVINGLQFSLDFNGDLAILVLTGPTGVGKTTALRQLADGILRQNAQTMKADPSFRPMAYTLAVASGYRKFDFKRLYRDGLASLEDPFCSNRVRRNDGRTADKVLACESVGAAVFREQLELGFLAHRTRLWIIDEAQHIIDGGHKGGPGPQYDVLKSISQTAGVRLLLTGTHDLPRAISRSGQLSRRSEVVTLNRYRWTDSNEIAEFASAVKSIMDQLPHGISRPSVLDNLSLFYVGTLGCVGIAKDWITRAYAQMLQRKGTELTIDHLKSTQLSADKLATINHEVVVGEMEYGAGPLAPDKALINAILRGATAKPKKNTGDSGGNGGDGGSPAPAPATPRNSGPKTPSNGTPFERAPTRDMVCEEV